MTANDPASVNLTQQMDWKDAKGHNFGTKICEKCSSSYAISLEVNGSLKPSSSVMDLFSILCSADYFKDITVTEPERRELLELAEKLPVPIKESVGEENYKVKILLFSYISRLDVKESSLINDSAFISSAAKRLGNIMLELVSRRGWPTNNVRTTVRIVERRIWPSNEFLFTEPAPMLNELTNSRETPIPVFLRIMKHSGACKIRRCPLANCIVLRSYESHFARYSAGHEKLFNCEICKRLIALYSRHSMHCRYSNCEVRGCGRMKIALELGKELHSRTAYRKMTTSHL